MPIGVVIDALSVALGGVVGALAAKWLKAEFKSKLNLILGLSSMAMGVAAVVLMKNMPAVIFSIIIGTAVGIAVHLEDGINKAAGGIQGLFGKGKTGENSERDALFVTALVLFCASGTGIYGSLVSGMAGDHSVLIAKSILDFFTAMIFACTLGVSVSAVAVPQLAVFLILFVAARFIYPMTDDVMIADFKACGGIIMLARGFRMTGIKKFNIADMIPAMIIVMPLSRLWTQFVLPLVS